METAFAEPASDIDREIKALIGEATAEQELKLQQELFKQKKRLADAERSLETKITKKAEEDKRIATSKISGAMASPDQRCRRVPTPTGHRIGHVVRLRSSYEGKARREQHLPVFDIDLQRRSRRGQDLGFACR